MTILKGSQRKSGCNPTFNLFAFFQKAVGFNKTADCLSVIGSLFGFA